MTLTVPIEAIEARAVKADPRRVILAVLLFVPFVLGWLVRKAWMVLVFAWMGLAYAWSAVVAGWQEAGRPRPTEDGTQT